jgi:hypothetical protein
VNTSREEKPQQEGLPRRSLSERNVGGVWLLLVLIGVIGLAALALYGLWAFWPSEGTTSTVPPRKTIHFFGVSHRFSRESLFFVMVAFAGALGGMVHGLRSLAVYTGNRALKWSWLPFYLVKPVLGAAVGTVFYVILRAGLFSPSTNAKNTSPYGFAAVAVLAGLFSDQALEKLKKVAEEFFEKLEPQADHVSSAPAVETSDAAASPTVATVHGSVDPRGQAATYWFEYGETAQYGSQTPAKSAGAASAATPVSAQLSGLEPGHTYHYRLSAKSAGGATNGDDRQFTTPAEPGG